MKVSLSWLQELVDLKLSPEELAQKLSLHTIAIRELTSDHMELDMKGYNRADLLSLRGVAYEVGAITDSQIKFTESENYIWDNQDLQEIDIEVKDLNLVPLYCIAKIERLKVASSSSEWVKKLESSGMRSINNVADITNLVMLEYGQPMHAFDASKIVDEKIIVRTARSGEELTTLDGKSRVLESSDLLITDSQNILGLAGVMGGKDSEITDSTTTILLEAAIFDPTSLRKTASRLNLQSEASKRFQHGLTKKNLLQALNEAISLYEQLGGRLVSLTIVGDTKESVKKVLLSPDKTRSLIGVDLSDEEIKSYLEKLYFKINDNWEVEVPYWRLDIDYPEDLIEEVARMYGYDKIPSTPLKGDLPAPIDQKQFDFIYNLKTELTQLGLIEVETYSFYSTKVLEALGFDNHTKEHILIKLSNPMSKETEYLRINLWPNLIEVIDKNLRQGLSEIKVFEIGKEFMITPDEEPREATTLAIAIMDGGDNPLAGVNEVLKGLGGIEGEPGSPPEVLSHLFHPKRFVSLKKDGQVIGAMAEVHPRTLDRFGIQKRVAILQIDLEMLIKD